MDDIAGRKPLRFAVMVAMGPEKMKDHFAKNQQKSLLTFLAEKDAQEFSKKFFVFFGKLSSTWCFCFKYFFIFIPNLWGKMNPF